MLVVAWEYREVFSQMELRESGYKCTIDPTDWELAKVVCDHLSLFYHLTEIFSGTKYPTANLFFPLICDMRLSLNAWCNSSCDGIKNMAARMIAKFENYWDVIHGVMSVASILDPRYKMDLVHFFFPSIYGDESWLRIEKIQRLCHDLISEYKTSASLATGLSSGLQNEEYSTETSSGRGGNASNFWRSDEFHRFQSRNSRTRSVKSELDSYLEEDCMPHSSDFDILSWWKTNKARYPLLSEIAKDFLAIPISTVASESAFSTGGRILSPHRSRLHPDTLEALMCTQNWLWSHKYGFEGILSLNNLSYIQLHMFVIYCTNIILYSFAC